MSLKVFQKILPPAKQISIFDDKGDAYLTGLREYLDSLQDVIADPGSSLYQDVKDEVIIHGKAICTVCSLTFENYELQREHFKLDWHRYNVKQNALGRQISSEEYFEEQVSEVSSISASDTEDEDLEPFYNKFQREISKEEKQSSGKSLFSQHPTKTFYVAKDDMLISFYKNVIVPQLIDNNSVLPQLKKNSVWIYLMLSAGHFAGAVFEKTKVIEHKTFHRYTVRAKRGTIQSVQDKKQGNAKSAGASIRRYNEAALAQDIQNLIESWSSHIKEADKIFFKCSTYHMNIIFCEKTILSKDDPRISKISVMTKRPTFKEVQRIHQLFSNISVYDQVSTIEETIRNLLPASNERTIEKEDVCPMPVAYKPSVDIIKESDEENSTQEGDIEEPKEKTTKTKKKKGKNKTEKPTRDVKERTLDENERIWNELYLSLKNNDTEKIKSFLSPPCATQNKEIADTDISSETIKNTSSEMSPSGEPIRNESSEITELTSSPAVSKRKRLHFLENNCLNFCSPDYNETLLHIAVVINNREMVSWLLEIGADPSIKDSQGKVPYDIAIEKETRNEFRRFMAKYPEKYDYKKANIPSPLSEEMETEQRRKSSEKKKLQQKARKEKLKAKTAIEKENKLAELERNKFDALSDREKRAMMAERRFAAQLTNSLRCSNCRNPIDEKKMFERFEFKYCSTKCVHEHKAVIGK